MRYNSIILTVAAIICLSAATMAQVPNYLPTNGLVGWWPFNGDADDESGNGNNGTVDGATLTADRFGNAGKAFSFGGTDFITVLNSSSLNVGNHLTINCWIKPYFLSSQTSPQSIVRKGGSYTPSWTLNQEQGKYIMISNNGNWVGAPSPLNLIDTTQWSMLTGIITIDSIKILFNSQLVGASLYSGPNTNTTDNLYFGMDPNNQALGFLPTFYSGNIDDISIWNRALTQEEITVLFNATNCSNNLIISPQDNELQTGSNANFIATTSDTFPSYIWQSDFGQGFQTLNNYGNYSGVNTNSLSISNVQLPNHTQPIRVISTSGECIDTSDVATISILDTCVTSTNDTTFITVTDTLVINTLITGINSPNNSNTIKVYPNPANSHITIEYGDFAIMNGYQLRIENSLGQEVFQTNISQQSDYLNLNTWSGNGLYFVHIVDPQGNTIDIRKIVLQ
jgi:hypothetical protein